MAALHPYAIVAVNRAVRQMFHYSIPSALQAHLQPGHLVEVEFGTAALTGVVVGFDDETPVPTTKPIRRLLDNTLQLTPLQLNTAAWIAENYHAPIGQCLWLMLPPGITKAGTQRYTLLDESYQPTTDKQGQLFSLLQRRGPLTKGQLDKALGNVMKWRTVMRPLLEKGVVSETQVHVMPGVRPKKMLTASLAIPPMMIPALATQLGRDSRRATVLEVLLVSPHKQLPLKQLMAYAGCTRDPIKRLHDDGELVIDDRLVSLKLPEVATMDAIIGYRGAQIYLDALNYLADRDGPAMIVDMIKQVGVSREQLKRLADDGFIVIGDDEIWRDPIADIEVLPDLPPPLTHGQQTVWDAIRPQLDASQWGAGSSTSDRSHVFLLHGVTGSGKTEIYMRAVQRLLAQGRQAIILVPEIALTAQLVRRFMARFPRVVSVMHSGLTTGERYDTWRRAQSGEIRVLIGARSALFVPMQDIGLVVLDEEHDDSFKSVDISASPNYHAREVAQAMMQMNRGTVILGSATPDVTSMYRAQQGEFQLLHMPDRVMAQRSKIMRQIAHLNLPDSRYEPTEVKEAVSIRLPPVRLIDMRHELSMNNRSIFSRELQSALADVLARQEQAILFLNRRGSATFVMCRDCGFIAKCPNCDTSMTYHRDEDHLLCHHCGNSEPLPLHCPECGSKRIRHFGTGTELVHNALEEMFPHARTLRWDQDTARKRTAHRDILLRFLNREADVLVGTQMIAKGLDIPLVTLVGIISGDTALGMPDYRVGERTFQLLTQVAGRAGRGVLGGRVILQTYQPDHYAVQAAAKHDYAAFYQQELDYRKRLRNPPYTRLVRLLFRHNSQNNVIKQADRMAAVLRNKQANTTFFTRTEVIGPTPCYYMRIDNVFRWQIIVRTLNPVKFFADIEIPGDVMIDIDPVNLL